MHKCSACINLTDKTTSWYTQYCFDIIGKKIRDFGQFYGAASNLESGLIRAHVLVAASGVRRQFAVIWQFSYKLLWCKASLIVPLLRP